MTNPSRQRRKLRELRQHREDQYQRAFDTGDPAYIAERWEKLKAARKAKGGRR